MNQQTKAMKLALEALEHLQPTALTSFYTIGNRNKAITALREVLAEQPAQPQPEPLQNIPSLTTVLAYLERLVPSEVYTGMIDVIEDEFQRKQQQQPAEQQQEPVAIVDDSGVIVVCSYHYKPGDKLYTSPPAQRKPLTDEQAYEIGAKGGEPSEAERLLFEAWMRGHCWAVIGEWDGKTYVHAHESSGFVHGGAMTTRQLWAAWRDRAALEAAHSIKGDA